MRKDVKDFIDECFVEGAYLRGGYTTSEVKGGETVIRHASTMDLLHPGDEYFDAAISEAVGRAFGADASLYTDEVQKEIKDYIKSKLKSYKPKRRKKR